MINRDTILSVFNEKGTLLKWLQKLEAILSGDTLMGAEIVNQTTTTAQIKFAFGDGSTLLSDPFPILKGETGPQGLKGDTGEAGPQGPKGDTGATGPAGVEITDINSGTPYIAGENTVTPITITYSNGETTEFTVTAKTGEAGPQGPKGDNGNGIVSIHTLSHSTVGNETVTKVEAVTDDGNEEFEVHAQNGDTKYCHYIFVSGTDTTPIKVYDFIEFYLIIINDDFNGYHTIDDIIKLFRTNTRIVVSGCAWKGSTPTLRHDVNPLMGIRIYNNTLLGIFQNQVFENSPNRYELNLSSFTFSITDYTY